jgi:NAD(P)-dependent dehydrogenase (short-subunit alcohol dehydrogenase family)
VQLPDAISLVGRRIAITGAAGGIGTEMAKVCAELGGELLLIDRDEPTDLAAELRDGDVSVAHAACDVTDRPAVEALAAAEGPVDALITAAGICPFGDWIDDDNWEDEFRQVMDVNVLGSLNAVRAWLPGMRAKGAGRIVLIGSIGGRNGGASPIVQPHYVASKGGIHALVWWLAKREAANGVLVNGVAPGPVGTEMTATTDYPTDKFPLGRVGTAREIAWPAAFLCTEGASYFSGSVLDVNGGLYAN